MAGTASAVCDRRHAAGSVSHRTPSPPRVTLPPLSCQAFRRGRRPKRCPVSQKSRATVRGGRGAAGSQGCSATRLLQRAVHSSAPQNHPASLPAGSASRRHVPLHALHPARTPSQASSAPTFPARCRCCRASAHTGGCWMLPPCVWMQSTSAEPWCGTSTVGTVEWDGEGTLMWALYGSLLSSGGGWRQHQPCLPYVSPPPPSLALPASEPRRHRRLLRAGGGVEARRTGAPEHLRCPRRDDAAAGRRPACRVLPPVPGRRGGEGPRSARSAPASLRPATKRSMHAWRAAALVPALTVTGLPQVCHACAGADAATWG